MPRVVLGGVLVVLVVRLKAAAVGEPPSLLQPP